MDSLLEQTRLPDETVICDGGSQDGTVAILQEYIGRLPGLQIIEAPGVNISQGRNEAIAAAAGPIIATTDAGVRLDCKWLEQLVAPLEGAEGSSQDGAKRGRRVLPAGCNRRISDGDGRNRSAPGRGYRSIQISTQQPVDGLPERVMASRRRLSRMARLQRGPRVRPAPESGLREPEHGLRLGAGRRLFISSRARRSPRSGNSTSAMQGGTAKRTYGVFDTPLDSPPFCS